jgi:hypothetical protein
MLQQAGRRRKDEIGCRRAEHDQVDLARPGARRLERVRRGVKREIAGRLAVGRAAALADAGARGDPLVGGIDDLLEIGVGDDLLRQIAAGAGDA